MNKTLGDQTLNHIEKLLVTTKPRKRNSPKKKETQSKSPVKECTCDKSKSPNKYKHALYQPMERDNALIQRQLKTIHHEMEEQNNYRVQNKHSYFLNAKNPKPPLYQRAQQIVKERQMVLQSKRQQKQREKNEKDQQQYLQFLEMKPQKKITKYEAFQLTDKLYKEHYSKTTRMNENKMEYLREEAKWYRNKPQINQNSRDIFKLMSERHQLDNNILERFKQYDNHKSSREEQFERMYRNYYYPFKPSVNATSRMLASKQEDSRSDHCTSCIAIKHDRSTSNLGKSQRLHSQFEPNSTNVSKFQ